MQILFDHHSPFVLSHGGFQIQVLETRKAVEAAGTPVDFLRWWDDSVRPDLIHFFGRPPVPYLEFARQKNIKVVISPLLTGAGSRKRWQLFLQRTIIASAMALLPRMATRAFAWQSFRLADACVALTGWEAYLMHHLFGAPRERLHVVPNGVEEVFLDSPPVPRGPWLVCTATITRRKRVLELAAAAARAQTPVWIVGRPYAESDAYAADLLELARRHPQFIRYEGPILDRARLARIYREARGFALLSTMESLSLSALEAAACGCPLLLSDLPWARTVFGAHAQYCPVASVSRTAAELRRFYDAAPGLPAPPRPLTWLEVGRQLQRLYETLLSTSR